MEEEPVRVKCEIPEENSTAGLIEENGGKQMKRARKRIKREAKFHSDENVLETNESDVDACRVQGIENWDASYSISEKGKPLLVIDGYTFNFQKMISQNTLKRWQCTKKTCKCYLKTRATDDVVVVAVVNHNHDKLKDEVFRRRSFKNFIKIAETDDAYETPAKVMKTERVVDVATEDDEVGPSDGSTTMGVTETETKAMEEEPIIVKCEVPEEYSTAGLIEENGEKQMKRARKRIKREAKIHGDDNVQETSESDVDVCRVQGIENVEASYCISERGKPLLVIDGYTFSFQKMMAQNKLKKWQCTKKTCKSYLKTRAADDKIVIAFVNHNHDKLKEEVFQRRSFKNFIKIAEFDDGYETPDKVMKAEKVVDVAAEEDEVMSSESPTTDNANGNEPTLQTLIKNPRTTVTTTSLQTNSHQSSSTTTRVSKTSSSTSTSSQRLHVTSDRKASNMKSDLVDFKNNLNDMKSSLPNNLIKSVKSSLENLVDIDDDDDDDDGPTEPLVTFPDDTPVPSEIGSPTGIVDRMSFEQKTRNNFKKTSVLKDGVKAEQESAKSAEMKKFQAGEVSYEEVLAAAATRARVETDGVSAEKSQMTAKEARSLKAGDISQQESKNLAHTNMKVTTNEFSAERTAMESQQQRHIVTSTYSQEKHSSSSSHHYTASSKGLGTSAAARQLLASAPEEGILNTSLDDLDHLSASSNVQDIERAIHKYSTYLDASIRCLQKLDQNKSAPLILNKINDVMRKAWAVPTYGHELGYTLCNALRNCGGLDLIMQNCTKSDEKLQFSSARLLEQCLTAENRAHVVEHGLDKVVNVACVCTRKSNSVDHSRVGTGILEHLFKHSEQTCSDVVSLGGLDALLFECRKSDVETLRHCAGALANLSLYGGTENQEAMIKRKVPMWLFPLAFHNDDNIKYYACLAITVLVANPEIEASVLQSGTLDLVEPFVTSHNPSEFAKSNLAHAHGQSKTWLKNLVPVLSSKREEARNLAAFHFCMEAGIKKQQGNTNMFQEIGAVESLKRVASCPNAVASKYAAKALRLIGEEVPHKLSQQVPLWSAEDVEEWVKQIGFAEIAPSFVESRVDGDLLLQLTEENLREDIGLTNGIKRKRFTRELQKLKKMADYTSRDTANINNFLQSLGPEFSIYTYSLLNAGVEKKDYLRTISEEQLLKECGIENSIHRYRIIEGIRQLESGLANGLNEDNMDKSLDVFVSYRRSNGSQLASLLKVHLQLRGFSVFIDVERLEAGKFDNNLLQSIQKAKHFLLVLTPNALDRCLGDQERKDWVHREIVAALSANCNIIPIIDNFTFPEPDDLPEDMRQVCHFNAVRWIHDYQDACVDKLERFMRGELNSCRGASSSDSSLINRLNKGDITPGTPSNPNLVRQPPSYQRMHSNDSGSGKGSDKDLNGNSGLTRD